MRERPSFGDLGTDRLRGASHPDRRFIEAAAFVPETSWRSLRHAPCSVARMSRFLPSILWCLLLSIAATSERASALEAQQLFAPIKIVPGARTLKDMRATHQAWAERVLI